MDTKFDEVVNDILDRLFKLKYDDVEKELIRTNILMNLYQMTRSTKVYERNVRALKYVNKQDNE